MIDVWIIHSEKRILVTDFPGPPAAVCGFVSGEAKQAAQARGYATVSEIGFPVDCHASFEDWTPALEFANSKAKELGYTVESEDSFDYGLGAETGYEALVDRTCPYCGGDYGDGWSNCDCDDDYWEGGNWDLV